MIKNITSAKIESIQKINSYMYELIVILEVPFDFKAGQFVSIFVNGPESRAFSLASSPNMLLNEKRIRFIIGPKSAGKTAEFISRIKNNDVIQFRGPYGIFTLPNDISESKHTIVYAATGTGIAPFISMIEYLANIQYAGKVRLYFGLSMMTDIILQNNFEQLKTQLDFEYKYCISQPKSDEIFQENMLPGHVTQHIIDNQNISDHVYVCGATNTVLSITENLKTAGYTNIFFENYG